jgi:hypothetical protein
MYEEARADDLTAALRELDAASALVRQRREELSQAVPAPSYDGCSPKGLRIFETKARRMNRATKRYLGAVGAFNAACQNSHNYPREESGRERLIEADPDSQTTKS